MHIESGEGESINSSRSGSIFPLYTHTCVSVFKEVTNDATRVFVDS